MESEQQAQEKKKTISFSQFDRIFCVKVGMVSYYDNVSNTILPVTVLQKLKMVVGEFVKKPHSSSREKNDLKFQSLHNRVFVGVGERKKKNVPKSMLGQFKKLRVWDERSEVVPMMVREVVSDLDEQSSENMGADVVISNDLLSKKISIKGISKGKGFAGSVKRFGFAGGPASHGSKFHRQPGSAGNRTWPGRVMPGKKFPGQMGNRLVSLKGVRAVSVNDGKELILVQGSVPGPRNALVELHFER